MSSSKEQEKKDTEYKLSSTQVHDFHKRYKWLGDQFEGWLGAQAEKNGWKKPVSTTPKKKWNQILKAPKAAKALWRDPDDRRTLSVITLERYSQFQDHRVLDLTKKGEFLVGLRIKPPENIVDALKQCITFRKKVNLHFENLSEDKIHHSMTLEAHQASNTKHQFFIYILEELLSMLVPEPKNDPVDPDQALRQEIVGRMRNVLKEMYEMTEGVMNAWEKYFNGQLSLSQATLMTHAAVERSQALENSFRDGQNQKERRFIQEHFADYDPKHLMDTTANPGLDLDWDVRVLVDGRLFPPKSDTFAKSMEILHFPTIYVLSNFQVMSKWWNHEYPIPGYPVSLENVVFESYAGKLSVKQQATRKKNLDLKTHYRDQIKIIWKFLNEILYLHMHRLGKDQQAETFGTLQELPGEEEDNKIFLPADIFSKALSDVINKPEEISMSTSYAIQLLAKICLRFQAKSSEEPKDFSCREDTTDKARDAYDDQNLNTLKDRLEPLRWRIYSSYKKKSLFWEQKGRAPGLDNTFEFEIVDRATAYLHVIDSDGKYLNKHVLPIRAHEARIHEVDAFFLDAMKCDVTWHAKTTEFYFDTQPLYAGTLELVRTLAEYRADLAFANQTLSVFALDHLRRAPGATREVSDFSFPPKVYDAMSQQQDWFPEDFKATGVEDILNLLEDKIHKTGEFYRLVPKSMEQLAKQGAEIRNVFHHKYVTINGDVMMNRAKPVETLWGIIALNHPVGISTFLSDLEAYYQKISRPKESSKLSKKKSKSTSSLGQSAEQPGPSSRSWKKDAEIVEKYWGVLPWGDADDNFFHSATQCNAFLETLGNSKGLQKYEDESPKSFNLRVLFTFLWLWKLVEEKNENGEGPFDEEDEDKIKNNMADQYKGAKRRRQGSGKRKPGGSSREHLARSDKRRKL